MSGLDTNESVGLEKERERKREGETLWQINEIIF